MHAPLDPLAAFDLVVAEIPFQHPHETRRPAAEDRRNRCIAREDRLDAGGGGGFLRFDGHAEFVAPPHGAVHMHSVK